MNTEVTIWTVTGKQIGKPIMERGLPRCSSQPVAHPDDRR